MGKGKRNRADREAAKLVHDYTQFSEGQYIGQANADDHPATAALIRRFNESTDECRQCPHLTADWDQTRFWVESVPELLACAKCTPVLAAQEKQRANSRCVLCGRHAALRGMSVAVMGYLLRGGICEDCEKEHGPVGAASMR
jgi:hypothetical protein